MVNKRYTYVFKLLLHKALSFYSRDVKIPWSESRKLRSRHKMNRKLMDLQGKGSTAVLVGKHELADGFFFFFNFYILQPYWRRLSLPALSLPTVPLPPPLPNPPPLRPLPSPSPLAPPIPRAPRRHPCLIPTPRLPLSSWIGQNRPIYRLAQISRFLQWPIYLLFWNKILQIWLL